MIKAGGALRHHNSKKITKLELYGYRPPNSLFEMLETKTGLSWSISSLATGGTKRRRFTTTMVPVSKFGLINKRLNKLSKKVKLNNPSHLYSLSAGAAFGTVSTSGTIYDLSQDIAQGDNYNQRFSTTIQLTRVMLRGVIVPGSTASAASAVRITVIRGQSALAFASNMTATYSPIGTNTSTQVLMDKYFPVAAAPGTAGYGTNIYINLKLNHHQKFTGTAAGTSTGESIYMICQSGNAVGTTAPSWYAGVLEIYFQPL